MYPRLASDGKRSPIGEFNDLSCQRTHQCGPSGWEAGFSFSRGLRMNQRTSGSIFHPTSLSNAFPICDLGSTTIAFADFLVESGQLWWPRECRYPHADDGWQSGRNERAEGFVRHGQNEQDSEICCNKTQCAGTDMIKTRVLRGVSVANGKPVALIGTFRQ